MTVRILEGDCRAVLATLPSESVHCVVSSPPYWGLRDYGNGAWEGGDPECDHKRPPGGGFTCAKCGARRVDAGIGLEPTVDAHVGALVEVFREVRRVLRKDGVLWLNYGDAYAGAGATGGGADGARRGPEGYGAASVTGKGTWRSPVANGYKVKDLMGLPWRVAFALQADGWWLRADCIWHKPNPMPESVTDRPTRAHEYVFLLSKSARYWYDAEAVAEPFADERLGNPGAYKRTSQASKGANRDRQDTGFLNNGDGWNVNGERQSRNLRTVWTIATAPFAEAHFATFPPALAERCIKAGCPAGGTVLDPFGGAGTVGLVADRLQRDAILIELNPDYAEMARKRITGDAPLFAEVAA